MRINHLKHKVVLALFAIAICKTEIASAGVADSLKNDTIVLSQDQIQFVEAYYGDQLFNGGSLRKSFTVNSQNEFEGYFDKDCTLKPPIDFSSRTLLVFPTESTGSYPYLENTVKIIRDTIICNVEVIHPEKKDAVVVTIPVYHLDIISIPKIKSNQKVVFKEIDSDDGISRGKYVKMPEREKTLVEMHSGKSKDCFRFELMQKPYDSVVKIYNAFNEIVYTGQLNILETQIDLSKLGPGVYEYKVFDKDDNMQGFGQLSIQ